MDFHDLTIKTCHEGLINKEYTALELTQAIFNHIDERDGAIGAYLSLDKENALLQAEKTDIAISRGERIGMLSGIPLAIKDNILIAGQIATAGSKMLEEYRATYDATVIQKLKKENAVIIGKTNMDEFAMGASTENSAFQKTHNPHNLKLVPGGSSGGSAAAVAADMAIAGLGSDTGGSIRQPAMFCNIVGMKPTYGSVSRHGLIAMGSSLDQIGPLTKTVEDAALLFRAISGHDAHDTTSNREVVYGDELLEPKIERIKEMIIGLPREYFSDDIDADVAHEIQQGIKDLKNLGITFKEISLPHTRYAISTYYIIMPAEISANLARYDGVRYGNQSSKKVTKKSMDGYAVTRSAGFGPEVKRRIILGSFVLSSGYYDAYYAKAQKVRALIAQDFENAFKEVDVILAPVSPTGPFKFGERTKDPLKMYLSDIFTVPVNLAGLPAIAMPPGFQLIGKSWHEADILGIGQYYERLRK